MRSLVHLSDLHFDCVDATVVGPLIEAVNRLKPDLIAVSGDLTQRARSGQFRAARTFLDALPQPQIVVPGNHDVPMHNVFARFMQPLNKYRRFITADLRPSYADEEIVAVGVNTARSLTIKGGRINAEQVAWIREKLCAYADEIVKIVVTHHPFDVPEGHDDHDLVGHSRMAMEALAGCGADLFLAGHLHVSHTGQTAQRYQIRGHSALVVQAGTATSTRGRGETNSFNLLHLDHPSIIVERFEWRPALTAFAPVKKERFQDTVEGWKRIQ